MGSRENRDLGGGRKIYSEYYDLADDVLEAHGDALDAAPPLESIAMIRNETDAKKSHGEPVLIELSRIPSTLTTLAGYDWRMEVYTLNLKRTDREFMQLLFYDALRRFAQAEEAEQPYLQQYDIREWEEVHRTCPLWRTSEFAKIPDICAEGFEWKGQTVQKRLELAKKGQGGKEPPVA